MKNDTMVGDNTNRESLYFSTHIHPITRSTYISEHICPYLICKRLNRDPLSAILNRINA